MLSHFDSSRISQRFSPRALAALYNGAWYEPGLNGSCFTTSVGDVAASNNSTVGLLLDKSKYFSVGSEIITNGDFSNGVTGWIQLSGTLSVTDGIASFTPNVITECAFYRTITCQVGRLYKCSVNILSIGANSTNVGVQIGTSYAGANRTNNGRSVGLLPGLRTMFFVASAATIYVQFITLGTVNPYTLDDFSVTEISGNHATQSVLANSPLLQISGNTAFLRHDSNDFLTANLPNLGGGVFSTAGSVYFATNIGMSGIHGIPIGISYNLPAFSSDIYGYLVLPVRLSPALEHKLEQHFNWLAGIAGSDYLLDDNYEPLLDDSYDYLLRA